MRWPAVILAVIAIILCGQGTMAADKKKPKSPQRIQWLTNLDAALSGLRVDQESIPLSFDPIIQAGSIRNS